MNTFKTIDEYIQSFPKDKQIILEKIRKLIKKIAPDATEKISYGMPTFYLNGNLVHFAAFKDHVGFFPTSNGIAQFENEYAKYKTGKGTFQFKYTEDIPYDLIEKVTRYRVEQNQTKK